MEERCLEGEPLAFVAERSQDPDAVYRFLHLH
jgi:hypothetical protein